MGSNCTLPPHFPDGKPSVWWCLLLCGQFSSFFFLLLSLSWTKPEAKTSLKSAMCSLVCEGASQTPASSAASLNIRQSCAPRHHNPILAGRLLWNLLEHFYAFEGLRDVSDPMKFLLSHPLFLWSFILFSKVQWAASKSTTDVFMTNFTKILPAEFKSGSLVQIVYSSFTSATDLQVFPQPVFGEQVCVSSVPSVVFML